MIHILKKAALAYAKQSALVHGSRIFV